MIFTFPSFLGEYLNSFDRHRWIECRALGKYRRDKRMSAVPDRLRIKNNYLNHVYAFEFAAVVWLLREVVLKNKYKTAPFCTPFVLAEWTGARNGDK